MKTVLTGEKSLLIACGDILAAKGHQIIAVGSSEAFIIDWATGIGVRCFPDLASLDEYLANVSYDLLFSIGNLRLIPEHTIRRARWDAINFHDGPLPRYAGLNAPAWAIIKGETRHGITWHRMTAGIDEGEIVEQRSFPIETSDTAYSLNLACYEAAIDSFEVLVDHFENGTIEPKAQALHDRTYFSRHQRPPAHAVMDWNQPAASLDALARGLDFGPYENPLCTPKILVKNRVFMATGIQRTASAARTAPGSVSEILDQQVMVSAADGEISITGIRTHAGKPVLLKDWIQEMELTPRFSMGHMPHDQALQLSALHARICRHETFWIQELKTFLKNPPRPQTGINIGRHVKYWIPVNLNRKMLLKLQAQPATERFCLLGACLLIAKASIDGKDEAGIILEPPSVGRQISGFEQYFTYRLPVSCEILSRPDKLQNISTAKGKLESILSEKLTFSWDLLVRLPQFVSSHLCREGPAADIALTTRVGDTVAMLPARLDLIDGPDGIGWSFFESDRDDPLRLALERELVGAITEYFKDRL